MVETEFEYDVAFSFAAQDEGIATQLNDLLSDRMKTFIYSERQRELAGTDGMVSFSEVYGRTARIVVVLYRKEWGNTPWTKVESEPIRARAHNSGFNFTTFIPTEANPTVPAWLPSTRLWVGFERFGISSAAAVIEARVTEAGGLPHEETVAERAERHKRANDLKSAQEQFESSDKGVDAAQKAYEEFRVSIEDGCKAIEGTGASVKATRSQDYLIVRGGKINLVISWRVHFRNSLEEAFLNAEFYRGFPRIPGFHPSYIEARKLHAEKFDYKLVRIDHHTYVRRRDQREFSPAKLADHLLKKFMDIAENQSGD